MRLKKRFFACAILAIMLSLMGQATMAYFTATEVAENVITAGGIDVTLQEKTASGDDFQDVDGVMPGDKVSKIVTVVNNLDDAYVRVLVDVQILDAEGEKMTVSNLDDLLVIDYDTESWTLKDGAWYYNTALTEGETTKPLFTEVDFTKGMTDEFQSTTVIITLQAQATQVANNGTDVFTAAGWPEA